MKIYISGPISDMPDGNRSAFAHLARHLEELGHEAVNPHEIHHNPKDTSWEGYMRRDIAALTDCDAIVMLPDWEKSRGARVERRLAQILGIPEFEMATMLLPK